LYIKTFSNQKIFGATFGIRGEIVSIAHPGYTLGEEVAAKSRNIRLTISQWQWSPAETFTHFTLHCYRIRIHAWAIRRPWFTFVNARANSILERFYSARNSKICFVRLAYGIAKAGNRWIWKGESWFHYRKVLFVGVVEIVETWFYLVQSKK